MEVSKQPITRAKETTTMERDTTPKLGRVIEIDEARIRDHLGELVRGSVEETLNALLDKRVARRRGGPICQATRYERFPECQHRRAGHRKILGIAKGDNRYAVC
jgi:hypothetical protein